MIPIEKIVAHTNQLLAYRDDPDFQWANPEHVVAVVLAMHDMPQSSKMDDPQDHHAAIVAEIVRNTVYLHDGQMPPDADSGMRAEEQPYKAEH